MTPTLTELIQEFWGTSLTVKFFAATSHTPYFCRWEDFYVSQIELSEASSPTSLPEGAVSKIAQLRFSNTTCIGFLNHCLGSNNPTSNECDITQVSSFESMVLSAFTKEVFTHFFKQLVKKSVRSKRKTPLVHLTWLIQLEPSKTLSNPILGKLILTIPLEAFKLNKIPQELPTEDQAQPALLTGGTQQRQIIDDFFMDAHSVTSIQVGTTRIRLDELEQLEVDDIVVLQNSQANQMAILDQHSEHLLPFPIEMKQYRPLTLPPTQDMMMSDQQTLPDSKTTLWDNLMIDVVGQFLPVPMPLHQLKQMSEGLVVELGDLIHNEIALQVAGKTLARGELVVVGDKFGVLIKKIEADSADAPQTHIPQPSPQANVDTTPHNSVEPEAPTGHPHELAPDPVDHFLEDDFDEDDDGQDDDSLDNEDDW